MQWFLIILTELQYISNMYQKTYQASTVTNWKYVLNETKLYQIYFSNLIMWKSNAKTCYLTLKHVIQL